MEIKKELSRIKKLSKSSGIHIDQLRELLEKGDSEITKQAFKLYDEELEAERMANDKRTEEERMKEEKRKKNKTYDRKAYMYEYMKRYYKLNKERFLKPSDKKQGQRGKAKAKDRYLLKLVNDSGDVLFSSKFIDQKAIAEKLNIPVYTVSRMVRGKFIYSSHPKLKFYRIIKIN